MDICKTIRGRRKKPIQSLIFLFLLLFVFSSVFPSLSMYTAHAGEAVNIPDINLRAKINERLSELSGQKRAASAAVYASEISGIEEIGLANCGISDVTGLERFSSVKELDLSDNLIVDVSPLSTLSNLEVLELMENRIKDFSPIGKIKNKSRLNVYATGQDAAGESITNTMAAVSFPAAPIYNSGVFAISDFQPQGKNGRYVPHSNSVAFDKGVTADKVSYWFSLTHNESSQTGKTIYMSGRVTHPLTVPRREITFNPAGGEIRGGSAKVQIVLENPLTSLPQVSKKGHTFVRWENGNGETAYLGYVVRKDETLTARWAVNSYKLLYDAGQRSELSVSEKTVTFGKPVGKLAVPSRDGYGFKGWFDENETRVTENTVHGAANDVTIYAMWEAKVYVITLDAFGGGFSAGSGGGTLSVFTKAAVYDKIYGNFPKPSREGWRFEGWWTGKESGVKVLETDEVKILSGVTLYARWSAVEKIVSISPVGKDAWRVINGETYRFDKHGHAYTGLKKINGYNYYFNVEGKLLKSGKAKVSGYVLKANGEGHITNMPKPNKTSVKSAKVKSGGKVSVKWHKLTGVSGYHVQYALDKKFQREIGIVDVSGRKNVSKTIKNLVNGKKYYVRVRGYFKVGGLKSSGKYSKAVRAKKVKK